MGTDTRRRVSLAAQLLLIAFMAAACSGGDDSRPNEQARESTSSTPTSSTPTGDINPGDFTAKVDHPLFSLSSYRLQFFEGSERAPDTGKSIKTRIEKRVLDKTELVAGVPVAVLEVKEYENDELVETTLDYFAQHRDGSVWYFGERIDDYEDGKIAGHEGQWLAGEGNAKPGLYMPAQPTVGQEFAQERAPGVAEDRSTILAVGVAVTTPAGSFTDCIRVKDYAPLSKVDEFKFYCPRVGIVREEEPNATSDLVRYS
jgi:hypothetical protein